MPGRKEGDITRSYPLRNELMRELRTLAADISGELIDREGLTHGKLAEMAVRYLLSLDRNAAIKVARIGAAYQGKSHREPLNRLKRGGSKSGPAIETGKGRISKLGGPISSGPEGRPGRNDVAVIENHDCPVL